MLKESFRLTDDFATDAHLQKHAGEVTRIPERDDLKIERVWGPVPTHEGEQAGAIGGASSVCVKPVLDDDLLSRVRSVVPEEVAQRPDDTVESLRRRLSDCSFFEPGMVLKGGKGPQRVQLNDTAYSQPRRRTWSVICGPHADAFYWDEQAQQYVYDAFYYKLRFRQPEDWKAYPMPIPIFDLGVALWHVAARFIPHGPSKLGPPNSCQLLGYYSLFGSEMVRHRDNFVTEQLIEYGLQEVYT